MRTALALLVTLALTAARPAVAEDFKVVVNRDNPVGELSTREVSRLFLKKTLHWPEGRPVRPVEPAAPALQEKFALAVHAKTLNAVKAYWNQVIFSGRDVPPLEKAGDAEVLAFVRSDPGAVGYVSPGADTTGVKVVPVRP